jgi:putative endonuclease
VPPADRSGADLSRVARGRFGEDQAVRWYVGQGWSVLDRNWRPGGRGAGELDLVVRRDACVVFAEVKARRSDAYGSGAEAVTLTKQRTIRRLALQWLEANRERVGGRVELRFDVVTVTGARVAVIEAAF